MATFKLEVKKEFGQFHHRVFAAAETRAPFVGPQHDLLGLLEAVDGSLAGLGANDTVVFRGVGYDHRPELREAVRIARY